MQKQFPKLPHLNNRALISGIVGLLLFPIVYGASSENFLGMFYQNPTPRSQQSIPNLDSVVVSEKYALTKKRNVKRNPFILGSDAVPLEELWSLKYNDSQFVCPNFEDPNDFADFPLKVQKIDVNGTSMIEGGEYKATVDFVDGVRIVTFFPKDLNLAMPSVKTGKSLVAAWVRWMNTNMGFHPCGTQYIIAYKKYSGIASAWLGFAQVGGEGGYNYYILIWHELTHTYYFLSSEAWLTEGIPNIIRYLILDDKKNSVDWSGGTYNGDNSYSIDNLTWIIQCTDSNCPEETILYKKTLCQLPSPGSYDATLKHAKWAEMFFADLIDRYGKKSFIDTLRLLYKKSKYSGQDITKQDFYKAFTYFIGQYNKKADVFVKERLCL